MFYLIYNIYLVVYELFWGLGEFGAGVQVFEWCACVDVIVLRNIMDRFVCVSVGGGRTLDLLVCVDMINIELCTSRVEFSG